jgi:hypothetical protein
LGTMDIVEKFLPIFFEQLPYWWNHSWNYTSGWFQKISDNQLEKWIYNFSRPWAGKGVYLWPSGEWNGFWLFYKRITEMKDTKDVLDIFHNSTIKEVKISEIHTEKFWEKELSLPVSSFLKFFTKNNYKNLRYSIQIFDHLKTFNKRHIHLITHELEKQIHNYEFIWNVLNNKNLIPRSHQFWGDFLGSPQLWKQSFSILDDWQALEISTPQHQD